MKKRIVPMALIAALMAFLTVTALLSCEGSFVDPGAMEYKGGGGLDLPGGGGWDLGGDFDWSDLFSIDNNAENSSLLSEGNIQ